MPIDVSQQLKEPVGSTQKYEIGDIIDISGDGRNSTVGGEITLIRIDRGFLATGRLNTAVKIACSRCLSWYDCPLVINIEEEYFPITDLASGVPMPSSEELGGFIIDERDTIDLTEAIRQNALLAIPMKPLCKEDCAGLCSECGHNLNQGPCGCQHSGIDPGEVGSQVASFGDASANKRKGKG